MVLRPFLFIVCLLVPMIGYSDIYRYSNDLGQSEFAERCPKGKNCRVFVKIPKDGDLSKMPMKLRMLVLKIQLQGVFKEASALKPAKPHPVNKTNQKRYASDIQRIARQHGLDPLLLHAVISAESAYNPGAVSHAGAQGLMQLMPFTARRFGVNNPLNPKQNIQGGARYLRWLLDKFNNIKLALAAYNAGEGAVMRYGNAIPPYRETQEYVIKVLDFYRYYRRNKNVG